MKQFWILSFLAINFFSACSFWEEQKTAIETNGSLRDVQMSETLSASGQLAPFLGTSLSGAIAKIPPISDEIQKEIATLLRTSVSNCWSPEYIQGMRKTFSELKVPDVIKKRSDAVIVNRCKVRATVIEKANCSSLAKEFAIDCEKLKSAITVVTEIQDNKTPEYLAAQAFYQSYFIDFEKFPPRDFASPVGTDKK